MDETVNEMPKWRELSHDDRFPVGIFWKEHASLSSSVNRNVLSEEGKYFIF